MSMLYYIHLDLSLIFFHVIFNIADILEFANRYINKRASKMGDGLKIVDLY